MAKNPNGYALEPLHGGELFMGTLALSLATFMNVLDTSIACILAAAGIAMAPLPVWMIAGTLGGAVVFAVLMDLVKVPLFRRLFLT